MSEPIFRVGDEVRGAGGITGQVSSIGLGTKGRKNLYEVFHDDFRWWFREDELQLISSTLRFKGKQ
jgi:hypothetical protein